MKSKLAWGKAVDARLVVFIHMWGKSCIIKVLSWYVSVNLLTLHRQEVFCCCCGFILDFFFFAITTLALSFSVLFQNSTFDTGVSFATCFILFDFSFKLCEWIMQNKIL